MSRARMINTCVNCKIPTSSQGALRWCLYCDFAADNEGLLTKKTVVRTSTGGEIQACLGVCPKYIVVRISGEQWTKPRCVQFDCDLKFTQPVVAKTKVLIDIFTPKEGQ